MNFKRFAIPLVVLLAITHWTGEASASSGSIDEAMKSMAKNIKEVMDRFQYESISIGEFTSPPQMVSSGGTGLAKSLISHLEETGIKVSRRAPIGFKGEYFTDVDAEGKPIAKVEGRIVDERGRSLLSFTSLTKELKAVVKDASSIASVMGLTFDSDPNQSESAQQDKLQDALKHPNVVVSNHAVRSSKHSPYAVEVHTSTSPHGPFQPGTPVNDEGMAFVAIEQGHYYTVELINDSSHDAAVVLTIDGLNVFAFSEIKYYQHFIVPARSHSMIRGWHRNNRTSDSFEVTNYSKSAAATLLPNGGSLGTITAIFSAAWPVNQAPPPDERSAKFGSRGTARGQEVSAKYREVERHVGVVRSSVSIRYEKD